jgi:hypothetical protein
MVCARRRASFLPAAGLLLGLDALPLRIWRRRDIGCGDVRHWDVVVLAGWRGIGDAAEPALMAGAQLIGELQEIGLAARTRRASLCQGGTRHLKHRGTEDAADKGEGLHGAGAPQGLPMRAVAPLETEILRRTLSPPVKFQIFPRPVYNS